MSRRPDVLRLFRRCRLPPRRGPSYWRSRSSRRRPKPRDEGRRACAILGWLRTASGSRSRLPRTIAVPGNQRDWIRLAAADRSEKFSVAFGIRVRSRRRLPFADFHGRVAILATGTAASARGAGRPANQGHLFETGSRPTIYIDRRSTLKVCTTPDTQGNSSADFLPVVLHRRGHQKTCPRDRLGAALHTNSKPAVERHGRSLRPHDEARLCQKFARPGRPHRYHPAPQLVRPLQHHSPSQGSRIQITPRVHRRPASNLILSGHSGATTDRQEPLPRRPEVLSGLQSPIV